MIHRQGASAPWRWTEPRFMVSPQERPTLRDFQCRERNLLLSYIRSIHGWCGAAGERYAETAPLGLSQLDYLPDEANASKSLLIISSAISNCSGGRLLRRSVMPYASFLVPSSKRIESLEIESVSQMRINDPIETPTTPRSISETFFVARETNSANLSCVSPAASLAIRI